MLFLAPTFTAGSSETDPMGNPWAARSAKKTELRVYLERLSHNQDSTPSAATGYASQQYGEPEGPAWGEVESAGQLVVTGLGLNNPRVGGFAILVW